MSPQRRIGTACLLLLMASSFGNSGGFWGAGLDWVVLILFFVLRNANAWVVSLMGLSMGVLVSLLTMGSTLEWIIRVEGAAFLVSWMYPLIRWDYPRNAILAFWTVLVLYGAGSWSFLEFLGRPETLAAIRLDLRMEFNTGIMGTLLIFGIYGTRFIREWMPGR